MSEEDNKSAEAMVQSLQASLDILHGSKFSDRSYHALKSRAEDAENELEKVRMQLAGCGVAAMSNTKRTVTDRIEKDSPYWSASYGDVCAIVDSEMGLRRKNKQLALWCHEHGEISTGVLCMYLEMERAEFCHFENIYAEVEKLRVAVEMKDEALHLTRSWISSNYSHLRKQIEHDRDVVDKALFPITAKTMAKRKEKK